MVNLGNRFVDNALRELLGGKRLWGSCFGGNVTFSWWKSYGKVLGVKLYIWVVHVGLIAVEISLGM